MRKINLKRGNFYYLFNLRLLKKNYCPKCGKKYVLKKLKYKRFYDHKVFATYDINHGIYYYCEKCDFYIKYSNQKGITKQQKNKNCKILPDADKIIKENKINVKKEGKIYVLK